LSVVDENQCDRVWLLPYHSDPIEYLCQYLVTEFKAQLPDLTAITILMADVHAAVHFRQRLTHAAKQAGFSAVLGPNIQGLASFINDNNQRKNARTTIPAATRELMLVEALSHYPDLYGKSSPWLLAENLLQLFDELSQQQTILPDDIDRFTEQVKHAYSIAESADDNIDRQLSHEATLVHTLWKAWQQQLADENYLDQHQLYIEQLAHFTPSDEQQQLFLLGYTAFIPAEQQWFTHQANLGKATLIIQGYPCAETDFLNTNTAIKTILDNNAQFLKHVAIEGNAYEEVLDDIYTSKTVNIATRAGAFATHHRNSPLQNRLAIFAANNAEQEALGIELQIRQWLKDGKKSIGIVTEDRRLARRLRALLERTGIVLRNHSGWALSTTRAAAALERWLECIEQDFNHLPLLDLLKSSFVFSSVEKEERLYHLYRFEQDIVLHENIADNLNRYQQQIDRRASRIDEIWTQDIVTILNNLIDTIQEAAKPLQKLLRGKHNPARFLDALLSSMEPIEMHNELANDAAGQRMLDEINNMRLSITEQSFSINWSEFRHWLGRTLERHNFVPPASPSKVQLLDLHSSLLCQFDALIIASADAEHLPGRRKQAVFFNDAVRYSLKLSTSNEHSANLFYRYRCLLHAAPTILVSYSTDNDGNVNLASPWLECLQHYHQIAWDNSLASQQLANWLDSQYTGYSHEDKETSPALIHEHTSTQCDSDLLPAELSSSAYQQLIDCPYQFFGARCLNLKATDEIRLILEKSDYGSRVHRCLQAFHSDVEYLPGPFSKEINNANRTDAITCLTDISTQIFAYDLEDNFQHRGWLQTWQELIPLYIDWQIRHSDTWQVSNTEQVLNNEFTDSFTLKGILDRIDKSTDGTGIIDYKTGKPPSQKDIESGEAVQLPFYALLLGEHIRQVEYLELNSGKVKTSGILQQGELHNLMQAHTQRLTTISAQLHDGEKLPAWGDSKICSYCDMDGLCRRGAWEVSP